MKSRVGSGLVLAVLAVVALLSATSVWADIPLTERRALITLYNSTTGDGFESGSTDGWSTASR